jgi:hypothetical protein
MQQRKYLTDTPEIGIESEDLALFRVLAQVFKCSVEDVIDHALVLGAHVMRSNMTAQFAPDGVKH